MDLKKENSQLKRKVKNLIGIIEILKKNLPDNYTETIKILNKIIKENKNDTDKSNKINT